MFSQPIKTSLLVPALALVWTALAAPAAHARDAYASSADVAFFKALEVKLWDAWNKRLNPADAAPFYSQDPRNLYFDFSPLKFTGWKEYEETAGKALAGGGHAVTHIHDDFTALRRGDLVVVAFTFDVAFEHAGMAAKPMDGRETDVWVKEKDGKWRIVHQHMSMVPGP